MSETSAPNGYTNGTAGGPGWLAELELADRDDEELAELDAPDEASLGRAEAAPAGVTLMRPTVAGSTSSSVARFSRLEIEFNGATGVPAVHEGGFTTLAAMGVCGARGLALGSVLAALAPETTRPAPVTTRRTRAAGELNGGAAAAPPRPHRTASDGRDAALCDNRDGALDGVNAGLAAAL